MMRHHQDNIEEQITEYKKCVYENPAVFRSGYNVLREGKRIELPENFLKTSAKIPDSCPVFARKTFAALREDPYATNKALSEKLGVSDRTIRAHIRALKREGLILRAGSSRSGYWKLLPK